MVSIRKEESWKDSFIDWVIITCMFMMICFKPGLIEDIMKLDIANFAIFPNSEKLLLQFRCKE